MRRAHRIPLIVAAVVAAALGAGASLARAAQDPPLPSAEIRALQAGALGPDRIAHASLALTAGLGAGIATRRPAAALTGALALGLAKEVLDVARGRRFDAGDLAADAAGAAAAAALTHAIAR